MICHAFEPGEAVADALPERIVVEGFRHWLAGYASGQIQPWECLRMTCEDLLGPRTARNVITELGNWVRVLSQYKSGGLHFAAMGTAHMTRDEELALALVAAAQHGDEFSSHHAARHLAGERGALAAVVAACDFATALQQAGQILSPVQAAETSRLMFEIQSQNQGVRQIH